MNTIHDTTLPPLEPDLVGWEPVVGAIRKQIAQQREEQNMRDVAQKSTGAAAKEEQP